MDKFYSTERWRAVDAKFEAQKLAFAPYAFQAARTMRDTGILEMVSDAKDAGVDAVTIAKKLGMTEYAVATLLEYGLTMELVKLARETEPLLFTLGKVGFFIQFDDMTRANMDFMHDVCYEGAFKLKESFTGGKPEGLKVFGDKWKTIYEALSSLPADVQKSWFAFDHFYSDVAFPEALPIVFKRKPKQLFDIGGNTAKWALSCFKFDPDVKVTILDLPGQANMANQNIAAAGAKDRVSTHPVNVLDPSSIFPKGADAVWMSQFLDCFALPEIESILRKVGAAVDANCDVYVLEPFWDQQKYTAAAYSLHATSMYFCNMANGNSKMYRSGEMIAAIEKAGFKLEEAINNLGANAYTLLRFRKAK